MTAPIYANTYDIAPHVAEMYDRHETQTADIEMIRRLTGSLGTLRILEPFCGTGRILIPLAKDGHDLMGMDVAQPMLDRAAAKLDALTAEVRQRVRLLRADVVAQPWPGGFDLVILGGNCLYELRDAEQQEQCIRCAAEALRPGGHLFVDNDHMEGPLHESWTTPGLNRNRFPSGKTSDGTVIEGYTETLDCDAPKRIWRARRMILVTHPDGRTERHEHLVQKHPVSCSEARGWIERHGLTVEQSFGAHDGSAYSDDSPRAIFWARK